MGKEYWMIYRGPSFSRDKKNLAPRPPPNPLLSSVNSTQRTGRRRKRDNLLTGEGGGRGSSRSRIIRRKKARSSVDHSILSGYGGRPVIGCAGSFTRVDFRNGNSYKKTIINRNWMCETLGPCRVSDLDPDPVGSGPRSSRIRNEIQSDPDLFFTGYAKKLCILNFPSLAFVSGYKSYNLLQYILCRQKSYFWSRKTNLYRI